MAEESSSNRLENIDGLQIQGLEGISPEVCFGNIGEYDTVFFNDDGYVTGSFSGGTAVDLDVKCCEELGMTFDASSNKCRWFDNCSTNDPFKIVLASEGNDGAIFQIDENETCVLEVEFDYLLLFNCDTMTEVTIDTISINIIQQTIVNLENQLNDCTNTQSELEDDLTTLENSEMTLVDAVSNTRGNEGIQFSVDLQQVRDEIAQLINEINEVKEGCDEIVAEIARLEGKIEILQAGGNPNDDIAQSYIECVGNLALLELHLQDCQDERIALQNQYNAATTDKERAIILTQINLTQAECDSLTQQIEDTDCDSIFSEIRTGMDPVNCMSNFQASITVEKVIPQAASNLNIPNNTTIIYQTPVTTETVASDELITINDLSSYVDGNEHTGIVLSGENCDSCSEIIGLIREEFNQATTPPTLYPNTFSSDWLHHKLVISDPALIAEIKNERIKVGIEINSCECDFSILLDNIQINKNCSIKEKDEIYINKCPSFNLKRVPDNKKSWISSATTQTRDFGLSLRETEYETNHHKLVINTKEVDLDIDPATAIECDVMVYINNNNCLVETPPLSACTHDSDECSSIESLLCTPLSSTTTTEDFTELICEQLIDVKSRKVLSGYPVLRSLYDKYRFPMATQGCTGSSKSFNYCDTQTFADLIGSYWIDLVEQVVPATTIWGASYIYRNTAFDKEKFKYKRYNLITCKDGLTYDNALLNAVASATTGVSVTVEVLPSEDEEAASLVETTDGTKGLQVLTNNGVITVDECINPTNPSVPCCEGVVITNINDESEFYGTVTIVGGSQGPGSSGPPSGPSHITEQ